MNKTILTGRMVQDPELRTTANGREYVNFTIAVDRRKDKDGNVGVDFIDCAAWGPTAKAVAQWCEKGRKILVEGELRIDSYEKDGVKRKSTRVVVNNLEFIGSRKSEPSTSPATTQETSPVAEQEELLEFKVIDDAELPF